MLIGVAVVVVVGAGVVYAMNQSREGDSMKADTNAAMMQDQNQKNTMNTPKAEEKKPVENGVMVGGAMMLQSRDIVDNAVLASNVTTVVAAVKAAGLVETLKGPGPFTVFAPTDAAFKKLPAGTVETLVKPENKAKLSSILTYHVVAGRYTSADLMDGQKLKTVNGQEITINKKDGKISVNGGAMVETADVISINGVTFVIDTVLMPK